MVLLVREEPGYLVEQKKDKIFWHDAHFEAVQLELHEYLEALQFIEEHPLSKEALIVDVLVIKKEQGVKIGKNIGKIFKDVNLIEFKSEKDSLTIDDYNKMLGYAYLYASFTSTNISDITISFSVTKNPRNLLKYLESDRKFKVTDFDKGISHVEGDVFPAQIIESKELSSKENLFLKNLRSNLDIEEAKRTVEEYKKLKEFNSKNAYIHRLISANLTTFKEMMDVSDTAIREVVIRAVAEEGGWLKERDAERDLEKAKETAKKMLVIGRPVEEIVIITELPHETVLSLA
jgi:hypothetical protein